MGSTIICFLSLFLVILAESRQSSHSTERQYDLKKTTKSTQQFNPLEKILFNNNELEENKYVKQNVDGPQESKLRVKRQYGYGYGYGRRPYYPIPINVGGFGYPIVGGRGFGRGFGGRGFGGRGFGGRGFGGRGFGGRGIGGIGGRGIGGFGGHGGGRG